MYIENFGSGVYTVMKFIAYNGLYIYIFANMSLNLTMV